jgi:hypothetical protein
MKEGVEEKIWRYTRDYREEWVGVKKPRRGFTFHFFSTHFP